eukprot:13554384-Alexandrium_andersonii.AAC.1
MPPNELCVRAASDDEHWCWASAAANHGTGQPATVLYSDCCMLATKQCSCTRCVSMCCHNKWGTVGAKHAA